ncbi:MAG: hypothetical protein AAGA02_17140, partial [Bacteroidota bacterium]
MKQLIMILFACSLACPAQSQDEELHKQHYLEAYQELQAMLNEEKPLSFKRAVYLTENAYLENSLDYE